MVRRSSFIIGLGLALFWWIGFSLDHRVTLLWFDAIGAVMAFAIGGLVDDTVDENPANAFGPGVLGLGLTALWIAGVASRQPLWFTWLNFLFAALSLGLAVMAYGGRHIELRHRALRHRV